MKTAIDLYQRIPSKYRPHVLACLAGLIILLVFMGMTAFWALKAAISLGFKLFVVIAICAVAFKIYYELKKKKAGGNT